MTHYGNKIEMGYISWPEGQPERVRFTGSYLRHQWHMLGAMGWGAMLSGRP